MHLGFPSFLTVTWFLGCFFWFPGFHPVLLASGKLFLSKQASCFCGLRLSVSKPGTTLYFKGGYWGVSVGYRQTWPGCIGLCGCWFRMSPSPLGLCSGLPGTWAGWCLEPYTTSLYTLLTMQPAHHVSYHNLLRKLFILRQSCIRDLGDPGLHKTGRWVWLL